MSYRMAPTSMTLSELKCHFCCLESYSSMNTARINLITLCVYMNGKLSVVCNRNCFPKLKDFSRLGPLEAVVYTVKVVVSKKWCKIDTLLLHTTNRKYYMAYRFVPFPETSDDLEGHSPVAGLINYNNRRIFVRHFPRFQVAWRVARSLSDS